MKTITQDTFLPISFIAIISSVIMWACLTYAKVEASAEDLNQNREDHLLIMQKLDDISTRISRMEGAQK